MGVSDSQGATSGRGDYLGESERPWASLLFLLPMLGVYHAYVAGLIGFAGWSVAPAGQGQVQITAFVLLKEFFGLLNATGRHLPAFALIGMLLSAHLFRRDPWRIRTQTFVAMALESAGWAIPLLAAGFLVARYLPLGQIPTNQLGPALALCFGAGIYEEMVFRLIGVTLLSLILRDVMKVRRSTSTFVILLLSGVLFSAYHHLNPQEVFQWRIFLFRAVAGAYFTLLYGLRGFGVTAVCHAFYDVVAVTMVKA